MCSYSEKFQCLPLCTHEAGDVNMICNRNTKFLAQICYNQCVPAQLGYFYAQLLVFSETASQHLSVPAGLQGLMLAAILSALMSTLTSVFNSTSALFSVDVWLVFRPNAHEREVMVVSRACIFVLMVLSISWLPVHQQSPGGQLWDIVQSVSAYCSTPVSVIMIMSILSKRTTEAVWQ